MKTRPNKSTKALRAAAEKEAALADFTANFERIWLEIWCQALRLSALIAAHPDFSVDHAWWADGFRLDPMAENFRVEALRGLAVSKATLTFDNHTQARRSLEDGASMLKTWFAEQETLRLAEIARQNLRIQALSKLTEEEKRALNLPLR